MDRNIQTVYITKYALTQGILEVQGEIVDSKGKSFVTWKHIGTRFAQYAHGKDWHTDRAAAVKQAEAMVANKIQSVEKQLKRLKGLTF